MSVKEKFDFLTLKMLPLALALIKAKIFLTHWSENAHFTLEFRFFNGWRQFSIESGHFLTNGAKRWRFFDLINARANGNIFRAKKSHISLRCVFLNTL